MDGWRLGQTESEMHGGEQAVVWRRSEQNMLAAIKMSGYFGGAIVKAGRALDDRGGVELQRRRVKARSSIHTCCGFSVSGVG